MSESAQMRLVVTPMPEGILWEIRDSERRIGHGSEATFADIRGVEIRAGVARVQLIGRYVDAAACFAAKTYGWEIVT